MIRAAVLLAAGLALLVAGSVAFLSLVRAGRGLLANAVLLASCVAVWLLTRRRAV